MLRSIAKDAAAQVASWTGLNAVTRKSLHHATPYVVGYHRVVERLNTHRDFALPAMEISVAMLEKHLDWLGKRFEFISVDDLATRRARSKPLAAVTFDDGYSDVFHHGFPLLKRKGIPAAIFVVTDLVSTSGVPVHDRLYAVLTASRSQNAFSETQLLLRTQDYDNVLHFIDSLDADGNISRKAPAALYPMTWEMLVEMRNAGMTIGSHSKTHAFLTNEGPGRLEEEVRDSRSVLQQRLGIDVDCFAYPGGCFNTRIVDAVHAAGYRLAFTDCRHRDDRYPMLTVPRQGLWERACTDRHGRFSPAIMSCHSAAMFDRFSRCPSDH